MLRQLDVLTDDDITAMKNKYCSPQQKQLETKHINNAMRLLGEKFPEIGGRFCTTYGQDLSFPQVSEKQWLQILHDNAGHWVLGSSGFVDGKIRVYDSLSSQNTKHVVGCLSAMLRSKKKSISIVWCGTQKQSNSFDCGVYAIAFATSLAFSQNPSAIDYDSKLLRNHLIFCFEKKELYPFPSKMRLKPFPDVNTTTTRIYCHCRRTDLRLNEQWEMIDCAGCGEDFHRMCDNNIPPFTQENKEERRELQWLCKICIT